MLSQIPTHAVDNYPPGHDDHQRPQRWFVRFAHQHSRHRSHHRSTTGRAVRHDPRLLTALPEPSNLAAVKDEVIRRWGNLDLLDVLKDADFLTEFSTEFTSVASREVIDRDTLRRRLLLCLFAHAETWMLALHLLQSALVHVNTLLVQTVLETPEFHDRNG
jgi:hypothetical protein